WRRRWRPARRPRRRAGRTRRRGRPTGRRPTSGGATGSSRDGGSAAPGRRPTAWQADGRGPSRLRPPPTTSGSASGLGRTLRMYRQVSAVRPIGGNAEMPDEPAAPPAPPWAWADDGAGRPPDGPDGARRRRRPWLQRVGAGLLVLLAVAAVAAAFIHVPYRIIRPGSATPLDRDVV